MTECWSKTSGLYFVILVCILGMKIVFFSCMNLTHDLQTTKGQAKIVLVIGLIVE